MPALQKCPVDNNPLTPDKDANWVHGSDDL